MNLKEHLPYRGGQLHQICSKCNWWQAGHGLAVSQCPLCGAPTDHRIALEFGGFVVEFDGTRFNLHDAQGNRVVLDEADYPEAIAFMQRHAKVELANGTGLATHQSPWPIRSGAGGYKKMNPRMRDTDMYNYWAGA